MIIESALRGTADSLLDSASYRDGARWVLLSPAPAAGVVAGSRARPSTQTLTFSLVTSRLWLMARHSSGPPGWARRLLSHDRNQK
jgi:hypothetical protein